MRGQQPAATPSGPAQTQRTGPIAKVDAAAHDFGTTWIGTPLKHEFTITNAGNAPLKILKVQPGCGCTVTGKYPDTIAPGASGRFPFSLNTNGLYNRYSKPITITTNDPVTPELKLVLQGTCKHYVDVSPVGAYFSTITEKTPQERRIRIKNNAPEPLKLALGPQTLAGQFKFDLTETKPGQEFELRVSLTPPAEPGDLQGTGVLTTNIDGQKTIQVRAFARIPPRIDVQPDVITLVKRSSNLALPERTISQLVRLNNYGETPVRLLEATADDPALKVSVTEQTPGKAYFVRVEFDIDYEPPPEGRSITLKTDDARTPIVRVPVRRWPPAPAPTTQTAAVPPATRPVRPVELKAGTLAPSFSLKTLDGKVISSDDLQRANATVLNFVAPNCPHCRKQVPMIEKVRGEYAPRNVRFLNISQTMGKVYTDEAVADVFKSVGSKLDLAADHGNQVGRKFEARPYPVLFVIKPDGMIHRVIVGSRPEIEAMLRSQLDALLGGRGSMETHATSATQPAARAASLTPEQPASPPRPGEPFPSPRKRSDLPDNDSQSHARIHPPQNGRSAVRGAALVTRSPACA